MDDLSGGYQPGTRKLLKEEQDLPPKKLTARELKAFTARLEPADYQAMQRLSQRQSASLQDTLTKAVKLYLRASKETQYPAQVAAPKLMTAGPRSGLGLGTSFSDPHMQSLLQSFHDLSVERKTLGLEVKEALEIGKFAGAHAENVNRVLGMLIDQLDEMNARQAEMTEFLKKLDTRINSFFVAA